MGYHKMNMMLTREAIVLTAINFDRDAIVRGFEPDKVRSFGGLWNHPKASYGFLAVEAYIVAKQEGEADNKENEKGQGTLASIAE